MAATANGLSAGSSGGCTGPPADPEGDGPAAARGDVAGMIAPRDPGRPVGQPSGGAGGPMVARRGSRSMPYCSANAMADQSVRASLRSLLSSPGMLRSRSLTATKRCSWASATK